MKPHHDQAAEQEESQYEKAFSRGNATSGAPMCSGSTKLAKAKASGVEHDGAVDREQLVVLLLAEELLPRPGQLAAHEQRHQAGGEEEPGRGDQVRLRDHLVVGGAQQVQHGVAAASPRRAFSSSGGSAGGPGVGTGVGRTSGRLTTDHLGTK